MTAAIERVRLYELSLPLVHSFETSSHRKSQLTHLLVEMTDADGVTGWGEIASPTDPFFTAETVETAWLMATEYLAPGVLSKPATPDAVEATWARIRGHEFAKAGFSIAAWDLMSRAQQRPLATALGGTRTEVVAGVSLGIEPSIDDLLEQVQRQLDAGYRRIKLKIAPGWDIEPVRAVRQTFGDIDVHVDANGAYAEGAEADAVFAALDAERLTMIEQPFGVRNFTAHASLQQRIETPICLDESIVTIDDLHTMLRLDAGRVLNIKVSRMGGLSVAKRAHDTAFAAGVPVWCGGMHEFGVGRAANVAISALPGFTLPSDVSGSDKYYAEDVIAPPVVAENSIVTVPTGPGLGHEVRVDWIRERTARVHEAAVKGTEA